jgi:hypothetical protein
VIQLDLTWDAKTDVAYLVLGLAPAGPLGPTLLLEPDHAFAGVVGADFVEADGRLVGLEVQFASRCLPASLLAQARRIDGGHLAFILGRRMGALGTTFGTCG